MEKSFFLTFFLLFCLVVGDVVSRRRLNRSTDDSINIDSKIVGGYDISIQDVPYQVFVLVERGENDYACGGSIISETYILTAAHCLIGASQVYVKAGATIVTSSGGTLYNTTRYRQHPLYNPINSDYDVGLINIPGGITLDGLNTKAVPLPDANSTIAPGTNLLITGWGLTKENGSSSPNLKAVQIPTISNDECRKTFYQLTPRQFCAGVPEGGKDACQSDSGGPAVATDSGVQLGIVSYGKGCGRPGYPGVYINVARIRSWIKMNAGV